MPLLCVGPSVQKCHRSVKIVDMSDERTDQSMCTTLVADSSEVCSDIVILGLVLSLVFAQKGRTTDLNTSSNVHLTDQVSLYNHQFCRPRF